VLNRLVQAIIRQELRVFLSQVFMKSTMPDQLFAPLFRSHAICISIADCITNPSGAPWSVPLENEFLGQITVIGYTLLRL